MELRLHIPTRWYDLNRKQLLFMANLYTWNHGETDVITKALLFLSGLKLSSIQHPASSIHQYTHPSIHQPVAIDDEILSVMAQKCRYLLEIGEINPVKWIKGARARHFRLYNATFEEYLMAENYYFAYLKTHDKTHLNNLASVLYRRPWQRWDAEKIQSRAKKFENIPEDLRHTVFMWYAGFRGYIPTRCPSLFSSKGAGGEFSIRTYISNLVHTLNGGDITRTDALMKQPLWYALDELEQRAKEADELEKIHKRKK